ncbi:hypothetical protein HZA42_00225 [Candidatus Peregrinibacteria bacterium]|nr:hypothetical protein [Candidatus Peregrinibacteria bacterium]
MTMFDKYPATGIYSFSLFGSSCQQPMYQQREQDCLYPITYYKQDGITIRPGTEEEIKRDTAQQQLCVSGVTEARGNAKVNDISQSLLYLILGAGILVSRKLLSLAEVRPE